MTPVIALIGRPNVGKSTLFNTLTGTRDALVLDMPGVTRDRLYGEAMLGEIKGIMIDTGGLSGEAHGIDDPMAEQAQLAVAEADLILFVLDAREGLTPQDEAIAQTLRQHQKPIILVVNKVDGIDESAATADFYALGFTALQATAASHRRGIQQLTDACGALLVEHGFTPEEDSVTGTEDAITFALIGRPNVGKSTLTNRMLGEERVIVYDMPGTTRDSITIPFQRQERNYKIIDTAGIRRKGRVSETIEKFSVVKTLKAIESAHVVVVVLDAQEGITDQDLHLVGFALNAGRGLVIAINKWDGLETDQRDRIKANVERKLEFVSDYVDIHFISALHGTNVGHLYQSIETAYATSHKEIPTPELTRVLEDAIEEHQPPLVKGRRIKLRYAHMGGHNPPIIVIHGTQAEKLPIAYQRYLMNVYRRIFELRGTPVRIELRSNDNPYQGKRNKLTPRQQAKRKRMMKYIKTKYKK